MQSNHGFNETPSFHTSMIISKQEAQLSQTGHVMLCVVENFAKSLKIVWNYTIEKDVCKFLLIFHCNYISVQ